VIGAVRDPDFGPLVMVGLGGIFVEILADVAFRICPITRLDAEEMLAELKGGAILDGARGKRAGFARGDC
jgi:acyl-CoA synthetase (NDP forming)